MIQRTAPILQGYDWKNQLARAIRNPAELLELLELPTSLLPLAKSAAKTFPLRVPHSYLQRIKKGDLNDPLLRQILPLGEELNAVEDFHDDPVGDLAAGPASAGRHDVGGGGVARGRAGGVRVEDEERALALASSQDGSEEE